MEKLSVERLLLHSQPFFPLHKNLPFQIRDDAPADQHRFRGEGTMQRPPRAESWRRRNDPCQADQPERHQHTVRRACDRIFGDPHLRREKPGHEIRPPASPRAVITTALPIGNSRILPTSGTSRSTSLWLFTKTSRSRYSHVSTGFTPSASMSSGAMGPEGHARDAAPETPSPAIPPGAPRATRRSGCGRPRIADPVQAR